MSQSLTYYTQNAQSFIASTQAVDFHTTQDLFLSYLDRGSTILDFGCGSGRDTKYFAEHGYTVHPTDGSEEMCRLASQYTGLPVQQLLFHELSARDSYDGIWACASILHVERSRKLFKARISALSLFLFFISSSILWRKI